MEANRGSIMDRLSVGIGLTKKPSHTGLMQKASLGSLGGASFMDHNLGPGGNKGRFSIFPISLKVFTTDSKS